MKRPSQILRLLPDATRRMLTMHLNELEDHGMIGKKVYPELPPIVEYSSTEIGWSLMPIIDALNQWGDTHREFLETVITRNPKNAHTTKSPCQLHLALATKQTARPQ